MRKYLIFFLFVHAFLFGKEYQVAFYTDFEPISYAEDRDPTHPAFNQPEGYEIDLLKAIEAIPNSNMTFVFHPVKVWDGIWLKPYTDPQIDIAMGGITREDKRLHNEKGETVIAATHKTTQFKQSLLMKAEEAKRIKNHVDLTCAYVVGAVRGTTGEYRYLAQAEVVTDLETGDLKKGMTVVLDDKSHVTSDGTLSIYDPKIASRSMLIPTDCELPVTKYFTAEDSMIPALEDGFIDAIARGYIGNKLVADRSAGKFVVNAVYSLECPKQESITCSKKEESVFFVKASNQQLREQLNDYIDYLTKYGEIGYDDWAANKNVFLERAKDYEKNQGIL